MKHKDNGKQGAKESVKEVANVQECRLLDCTGLEVAESRSFNLQTRNKLRKDKPSKMDVRIAKR